MYFQNLHILQLNRNDMQDSLDRRKELKNATEVEEIGAYYKTIIN